MIHRTRFDILGYAKIMPGVWRIADISDGTEFCAGAHVVGFPYTSKAELLADLDRYASDYGCNPCKRINRVVPIMGSIFCGCPKCDPDA